VTEWQIGDVRVTRVGDPDFELVLPSDDATASALRSTPWLHPCWVTDDWSLRVSSSALLVRSPDTTVVVDPWLVFDDPARHAARIDALAAVGCPAGEVHVVVNSHIDGAGSNLAPDGTDAFPSARYPFPSAEIDALERDERPGAGNLLGLVERGRIERVEQRTVAIGGAVEVFDLPGHNDGHLGVRVGGAGGAVIAGHLFLHPAQVARPEASQAGEEPPDTVAARRALLERCVDEDLVLIAPLFAEPGGGRIRRAGTGYELLV
jgi:glyoxylase-like metal-dependent hydrolase (beta-lactamase superfamily II)